MEMIYILMIWTVVGHGGTSHSTTTRYDWRPMAEFHMESGRVGANYKTAREMCEEGARQLGLKQENYRCIRSK